MSDPETRIKRAKKYKKRDPVAQYMNENKGAFSMKILNPKRKEYKRERLDIHTIETEGSEDAD